MVSFISLSPVYISVKKTLNKTTHCLIETVSGCLHYLALKNKPVRRGEVTGIIRYRTIARRILKGTAGALLLVVLMAALYLVTTPSPIHAQESEKTLICVDFSDWDKKEGVSPEYIKDDFVFTSLSGEPLFINPRKTPEGALMGLQIPEEGVNIRFPSFTPKVILRYMAGTDEPLEVFTFAQENDIVYAATVPNEQGIIHNITAGGGVSTTIKGGGNEAVLLEVCIEIESEQPVEEPLIIGVDPAEGHCGTEINLILYGANLEPRFSILISDGIEVTETRFINPEKLEVRIFITEDARYGERSVELIDTESKRAVAILEDSFTVIRPAMEEERRPDLTLRQIDWDIVEDGNLLLISALIENLGNEAAHSTDVYAFAQDVTWWTAEATTPVLDSGSRVWLELELEVPDELRGDSYLFGLLVDPRDNIAELNEENNRREIEIWIPEVEETDDDYTVLVVTIVVGGSVSVASVTLTARRLIKVRGRKRWSRKAQEDKPPRTCQPCTRYCRRVELKLEPALYKIAHLSFSINDPASGKQKREMKVQDKIVDGLNQALTVHRIRVNPEKLMKQVTPLAQMLSQQILEWLRAEPASRDISIVGH